MDKHTFKKVIETAGTIGLALALFSGRGVEVIFTFIFLEAMIHWVIPYAVGKLFYSDEKENFDGELNLKVYEDGDIDYILSFYHVEDIPNHDSLKIYVDENIRKTGTDDK